MSPIRRPGWGRLAGRITTSGIAVSGRSSLVSPWRAKGDGSCGHLPGGRGQAARTIYVYVPPVAVSGLA
jgi:hypothetical protein